MSASAERSDPSSPGGPTGPSRTWLVAPWVDLFFIANLAWPLLILVQLGESFEGRSGLQFWQVYYITTPHRWITLLLVFGDRDRFRQRRVAFVAVAGVVVAACLGVRLATGTLTCLLAVDYIWNAWHFAAQHHGIYRIYDRMAEPTRTRGVVLEKWTMRLFLLYVILRVASATWSEAEVERWLRIGDWFAVLVPVWLVLRDLTRSGTSSRGRTAYLVSVCVLYTALLGAVHERWLTLVLCLATASALFHAVEYLALVSWSVRQRHSGSANQMGFLGLLAARWGIALAVFVIILGAGGWLLDQQYIETWLTINVVVAFLHYAYDGMIWRRRAS
ncbi:MAG: hypothetical protein L0241_12100 [Planctomycetia bacterium]|nr:hypothetical protein [Planctomycetia bacterium]